MWHELLCVRAEDVCVCVCVYVCDVQSLTKGTHVWTTLSGLLPASYLSLETSADAKKLFHSSGNDQPRRPGRAISFFFFFFAPIWKQCRGTWGERIDASLIGGTDFFFGGGSGQTPLLRQLLEKRLMLNRAGNTIQLKCKFEFSILVLLPLSEMLPQTFYFINFFKCSESTLNNLYHAANSKSPPSEIITIIIF